MIYRISEIAWEDDAPFYDEIEVEVPDDMLAHSDDEIVDAYLETLLECDTGYLPMDFTWEPVVILPEGAAAWMANSVAQLRECGFSPDLR